MSTPAFGYSQATWDQMTPGQKSAAILNQPRNPGQIGAPGIQTYDQQTPEERAATDAQNAAAAHDLAEEAYAHPDLGEYHRNAWNNFLQNLGNNGNPPPDGSIYESRYADDLFVFYGGQPYHVTDAWANAHGITRQANGKWPDMPGLSDDQIHAFDDADGRPALDVAPPPDAVPAAPPPLPPAAPAGTASASTLAAALQQAPPATTSFVAPPLNPAPAGGPAMNHTPDPTRDSAARWWWQQQHGGSLDGFDQLNQGEYDTWAGAGTAQQQAQVATPQPAGPGTPGSDQRVTIQPVNGPSSSPPGPAAAGAVWSWNGSSWVQVPGARPVGDLTGGPGTVVNPPSGPGTNPQAGTTLISYGVPGTPGSWQVPVPAIPSNTQLPGATAAQQAQFDQLLAQLGQIMKTPNNGDAATSAALQQQATAIADALKAFAPMMAAAGQQGFSNVNVTGGTNITNNSGPFSGLTSDQINKYLQGQLGVGQLQEGQQSILGKIIGGMPLGYGPDLWKDVLTEVQQLTDSTGKSVSVDPNTGQLVYGAPTPAALEAAARSALLNSQAKQTDAAIAQKQQELDDARRAGDLDRQEKAQEALNQLNLDKDKLAESQRQFNTTESGLLNGQATLEKQKQDIDLALERANATGNFVDPVTGQSSQTLAAHKQAIDEQLSIANSTGYYRDPTTGQVSSTLAQQDQAFKQAQTVADELANPRQRIAASFLAASRGTLAGQPAGNQLAATTVMPTNTGTFQAGLAGAASMGQPGAADHYATSVDPDTGRVTHYFGTIRTDPTTGEVANIPVGAFSRALIDGQKVGTSGSLGTTGGYTTAGQLRAGLQNLNNVKVADYLKGNTGERQEFGGVASYATGLDDQSQQDVLNSFVPKTRSVSGGLQYA